MTERLHFHFSLSCIEEGNDNPLQYSCQEKPRDRGAWWAAIYGVAQSQTWLKRLSSSNSSSKFLFTPNACNLQCCEWITHTLLKPRDAYESPFVAQHFQNCVSQSLVLGMLLWSENESVSHSVMSNSLWPHKLYLQALLSTEFFRREYWSGLPFFFPGDLLTQVLNPSVLHCRQILYLNSEMKQWK